MNTRGEAKANILVIDDEQIVHESVGRILREEGYVVESALRVDEALEKLEKSGYDLVLTDLMMPDRSGMEAVEAVARDHPNTGVVMFTGFATVESAVESMKLGVLDYLPKPFTPDELLEVTHRAILATRKVRRDREIEKTYAEAEKALTSSLDLREILSLICVSVVKLFQVKGCAVLMFHKKDKTLATTVSRGLSDAYVDKGILEASKSISVALDKGEPVLIEKSDFDSHLQYPDAARKEGIVSILSLPLQLKGAVLGFMRVYGSKGSPYNEEDMELLRKFADQGALAMENAMSYERVRGDVEGLKRGIPGSIAGKIGS
jgi:CheY-like chemotaxis protein